MRSWRRVHALYYKLAYKHGALTQLVHRMNSVPVLSGFLVVCLPVRQRGPPDSPFSILLDQAALQRIQEHEIMVSCYTLAALSSLTCCPCTLLRVCVPLCPCCAHLRPCSLLSYTPCSPRLTACNSASTTNLSPMPRHPSACRNRGRGKEEALDIIPGVTILYTQLELVLGIPPHPQPLPQASFYSSAPPTPTCNHAPLPLPVLTCAA